MLNEKALTVNLRISFWSARKYDKTVSKEVEQQHKAEDDSGRYNKLLVDKASIAKITNVVGKIRAFSYKNTLPWGDNGDRLLPSSNYFNYISEINKLKSEFDKVTGEFVKEYPNLIQRAAIRLGTMFSERDYPPVGEIASKFGVKPVFLPVSDLDFRVDLGEDQIKELKTSAQIEVEERLNNAVKDSWKRIKEQLSHMSEKLNGTIERKDKDGNPYITDAIFKDSMFENLEELVNLIPRLNVTNDPNIAAICKEMQEMVVIDPNDVRNSQTVRKETAKKVDDIMSNFSTFFD